jgi:hypothetical protein
MTGAFGGFVVGMATSFKRDRAPVTAPIYAVLQGLFIGGFSLIMEQRFPGLVLTGPSSSDHRGVRVIRRVRLPHHPSVRKRSDRETASSVHAGLHGVGE